MMEPPAVEYATRVTNLELDTAAMAPSPDLDTAVALIELGGHPRILGREALAVLDAAGCARAVALVAAGAGGPRVIEARGWTEAGSGGRGRHAGQVRHRSRSAATATSPGSSSSSRAPSSTTAAPSSPSAS